MKINIKRFIIIAILLILAYEIFDTIRYVGKVFYNRAEITYLGTAKGKESTRFDPPGFWLSFKYLYSGNGYDFFDSAGIYNYIKKETNFHDLDFDLEIKKGKVYIYSYGVPIKKLEYYKGRTTVWGDYYNRAVFSKEEFTDGIYYFYEMDDIGLGDMSLEDQYMFE